MNITSKLWWKSALIRAVRTFAQAAVALIPAAATIQEVNWLTVLSSAALASVISLLMSLSGLPEVEAAENKDAENPPEIHVVYLDSEDEYTQTGDGRIVFLNNEEEAGEGDGE